MHVKAWRNVGRYTSVKYVHQTYHRPVEDLLVLRRCLVPGAVAAHAGPLQLLESVRVFLYNREQLLRRQARKRATLRFKRNAVKAACFATLSLVAVCLLLIRKTLCDQAFIDATAATSATTPLCSMQTLLKGCGLDCSKERLAHLCESLLRRVARNATAESGQMARAHSDGSAGALQQYAGRAQHLIRGYGSAQGALQCSCVTRRERPTAPRACMKYQC